MWRPLLRKLVTFDTFNRYISTPCPILVEKRGQIQIITINRPDVRNCINAESANLLKEAFQELDSDPGIKVGILAGKGGNFCAGYDLKELSRAEQNLIKPAPMGPSHLRIRKPTIAAIDGYAVAGGLELALLCDLRIVEETACLGVFCRRFGVPLIDGGTVRLPKVIGLGRALDLILTGRGIDGKEAHAMGLASVCVQTGCSLGIAINVASSLLKFDQDCLIADKESVYHSVFDATSLERALEFEFEKGSKIIPKAISGASQFVNQGYGKHGKFGFESKEQLMTSGRKKSKLLDD